MDFYEKSSGRGLEIFVGIVLFLISLCFTALTVFILSKKIWGYSSILVVTLLALCSFGFGKLGFRLVFNKPRKNGGLLSDNGLKLGCIFFGVSSIIYCIVSVTKQDFVSALSALSMLVACLCGWQLAMKRSSE